MNKVNNERIEKIENLKKYILNKTYGTTLSFDELNEFIGEDLNDERGRYHFKIIVGKTKKKLYKYGYVIRSIQGIGYYILKPNQIASYTYRTFMTKQLNSLYTAQLILEKTNQTKFNEKEKLKHLKTQGLNESLIYANQRLIDDEDYSILKEE